MAEKITKIAQNTGFKKIILFSEQEATVHCIQTRWNGKPACHTCSTPAKKVKDTGKYNSYWCKPCRNWFTVRTGTVMENSRIPARKWIMAIYLVVIARNEISSPQLSNKLDITRKSAWFMMQRLREAFLLNKKKQPIVEADELFWGVKEANKYAVTLKFLINLPSPKTKYKEPDRNDLNTRYKLCVDRNGKYYLRKLRSIQHNADGIGYLYV